MREPAIHDPAPTATEGLVWALEPVGALVCDVGGIMSHPAVIAREFGIPAVVGTGGSSTAIADGARIRVDGTAGTVTLL
jgi:pyruvate,water dikinase